MVSNLNYIKFLEMQRRHNKCYKNLESRKEKNKLKLKLLKHASYCLETSNNPELLPAVAELLIKINR